VSSTTLVVGNPLVEESGTSRYIRLDEKTSNLIEKEGNGPTFYGGIVRDDV
jgi:hypothetical protein